MTTCLVLSSASLASADTVTLPPLTPGLSLSATGTLGARDQQNRGRYFDTYTFEGRAGQRLVVSMAVEQYVYVNPYLTLLDPEGKTIAENNDCCGGSNARIHLILPSDGTYTLRASSTGRETGEYHIGLLLPQAERLSLEGQPNPQQWLRNAHFSSNVHENDDDGVLYTRFYEFEGQQGQQIVVMMSSPELDAYLGLFDQTENQLIEDDNNGGDRNARIVYTLPADGTYTIETSTRTRDPGTFNLWVAVDDTQMASELPRFFCDRSGRTPATAVRRRNGTVVPVIRWTPDWEDLTGLDGVAACYAVSERFEILDFNLDNLFITAGYTPDSRDYMVCAAAEPGVCLPNGLIIEVPSGAAAERAAERLNSAFQIIAQAGS